MLLYSSIYPHIYHNNNIMCKAIMRTYELRLHNIMNVGTYIILIIINYRVRIKEPLSSSTSHDRRGEYNNIKRIVDNILKAGLLMSTNERDRRTCGFCSADSFRRRQCCRRKKHSCFKHGSKTLNR